MKHNDDKVIRSDITWWNFLFSLFILQCIGIVLDKRINIHELAFEGLTNLDTLNIERSELLSPPPLGNIQGSLSKLRVINAKLSSIPGNYFSGCDKLSELKLSHNHLRALPDLSAISDTLDLIDVNYNELTDVRSLQDFSFPNLRYVFLDHNKIQQVDLICFNLPRVHDMVLSHNLLQEIGHPKLLVHGGESEVGPRPVKVRLRLNGNPWYCNSRLSWIASALQQWDHYSGTVDLYWNGSTVYVTEAQAMICHFPASVRGTAVINLGRY